MDQYFTGSIYTDKVLEGAIRTVNPSFVMPSIGPDARNQLVDAFVQAFTANTYGGEPSFQKIKAIKAVREVAFIGLRESKGFVEMAYNDWESRRPALGPRTEYQRRATAVLDSIQRNVKGDMADAYVLDLVRELLSIVGKEKACRRAEMGGAMLSPDPF